MKIFVVEPRGSGGMAHYAHQLCNALCNHAGSVTLVTSRAYELDDYPRQFHLKKTMNLWSQHSSSTVAPQSNQLKRLWRWVFRNVRRVFRGGRLFFEWVRLTDYLLRERPDIVQFGEIEFPFEAVFLKYMKSRGLVLTQICHEFEPRERSDGLLVRINNRLLDNVFHTFSAIFFHSQSNLERFRELYPDVPPERFHLIAMGNEQIFPANGNQAAEKKALMQRYHLEITDAVVLFFGTLTPSKGVQDLLRAFEKVHEMNSRTRLVIAGMPLKYINVDDLFETVSELGIQPFTCFDLRYLPMEDVGPLMDLATVVVFPYKNATQSASIQTAYAFGKPVVATRVGGLPDVVVDGKSGFLVEPNMPDQLSEAILKIINDAELAEKMGLFAKRLSETRFAWDPIAGCIVSIYKNI